MKFILFVLLSSLLIQTSLAQSNCTASEAQGLQKCWMDYLGNFGYKTVPPTNEYVKEDINYLSANGPAGFQKQCDWVKTRHSCEQPYLADCVNPSGISIALGISEIEATQYMDAEAVEYWECTDGYNREFSCKIIYSTTVFSNYEQLLLYNLC